jgi:hypothetical protein
MLVTAVAVVTGAGLAAVLLLITANVYTLPQDLGAGPLVPGRN